MVCVFKLRTEMLISILSDVLEAIIAAIYLDETSSTSASTCVTGWYQDKLKDLFENTTKAEEEFTSQAPPSNVKASYAHVVAQGMSQAPEKNLLSKVSRWTAPKQQSAPDLSNLAEFPAL